MNDNPWNVDNLARLQRERIQEEMKQIRLEESATKARQPHPSLVSKAWRAIWRWLRARETSMHGVEQRPVRTRVVKRRPGI